MFDKGGSTIGMSPPDRKAPSRLRGEGCYAADVSLTAPLHLGFARAVHPHGKLVFVDGSAALDLSGVHAVHNGADVSGLGVLAINEVIPLAIRPGFPVLAQDRVEYLGQPVAGVLAETPAELLDGIEAVAIELDDTEVPAPPHAYAQKQWRTGDVESVFEEAFAIVETEIRHPRLFPTPMETRGIAIEWSKEGLTIWLSTQTPHRARSEFARILGVDASRLRVIAPDVGGAFGMKGSVYPEEVFAVWAALTHRRSVRWIASRGEDMLSATQGRGLVSRGRMALAEDGRFLALDARVEAPLGPWVPNSGLVPAWNGARILPGPYQIDSVEIETQAVPTANAPIGIYRGAGRPEAACLMERLVELAAKRLGRCAMDLRLQNVYAKAAFPVRTPTSNLLDSGDYPETIRQVVEMADHALLLRKQSAARAEGRLFGIGAALYLEPSGEGFETARVTLHEDERVTVASGSSCQGQGRETAYAQIAGEFFDGFPDRIEVMEGDTALCPEGIGAVASRGTAIGGSAVFSACERVRARQLRGDRLPITEEVRYVNDGQAWGHGLYLVAVEIDRDTGMLDFVQVTCLDDAGRQVNPAFVEGQVRGGFVQGLGEALMEQVVYDGDGQLLTGSLMDYAVPRAGDIPALDLHSTETHTAMNALAVKGVGEAGTIGAPAAILNAALDALSPLGVTHLDMPLTPCKLWTAIRAAEEEAE